ncbi:MAG: hypothetical protein AAGA92_07170 [Planctomycetota bacterium]
MRERLQEQQGDAYERPNQPWVCGQTDTGQPCPTGPAAGGSCPKLALCRPVRDGDRWRCNRSPERGGPCPEGPEPDGACTHVLRCSPVRTMRTVRGRIATVVLLAATGAALMLLSSEQRNAVLKPGPLSTHHAQIVDGLAPTASCATCHPAADDGTLQWAASLVSSGPSEKTQTTLCLNCHGEDIPPPVATGPHSMDPEVLLAGATSSSGRRFDPREPLACSACHREHHGAGHDLSLMSNQSCQACHQERYHSFAGDHPEFTDWPHRRRTGIAFDHASHQLKHHPERKTDFTCASCHELDPTTGAQRTLGYQTACASCHDESLGASLAGGVPLLSLPMLDTVQIEKGGHDLPGWPESLDGDFDGMLPMPAKLLLLADPDPCEAIDQLGPRFDFFDVDPDDRDDVAAAAAVACGIQRLVDAIAADGQAAIGASAERLVGRELSPEEVNRLAAGLSPATVGQLVAALRDEPPTDSPAETKPVGGWVWDNTLAVLRYHPAGHDAAWLAAWLDLAAEAASGELGHLVGPLLVEAMAPTAPGQCGSCHSLDQRADGRWHIHWQASTGRAGKPFTKFSHRPHVLQPLLADCSACHTVDAAASVSASYTGHDPHQFTPGFLPVEKNLCASCHTPQAAGDSCQKCHNYHVSWSVERER